VASGSVLVFRPILYYRWTFLKTAHLECGEEMTGHHGLQSAVAQFPSRVRQFDSITRRRQLRLMNVQSTSSQERCCSCVVSSRVCQLRSTSPRRQWRIRHLERGWRFRKSRASHSRAQGRSPWWVRVVKSPPGKQGLVRSPHKLSSFACLVGNAISNLHMGPIFKIYCRHSPDGGVGGRQVR